MEIQNDADADADDDDEGDGDDDVPTTHPSWQVPESNTHREQISRSGIHHSDIYVHDYKHIIYIYIYIHPLTGKDLSGHTPLPMPVLNVFAPGSHFPPLRPE